MAAVRVSAGWALPLDSRALEELGRLLLMVVQWASSVEVEIADAEGFRVLVALPQSMLPGLDYKREFVEALRELSESFERLEVEVEEDG